MKAKGNANARKKPEAPAKAPRRGVGAKGAGRPAIDERPKWRGGGKKGENEQTAR